MTPSILRGLLIVCCFAAFACGGNEVVTAPRPPADLNAVSPAPATVRVGERIGDSLRVRVTDGQGGNVTNVRVTWSVTRGSSTVNPTLVVSDAQGIARTAWTIGSAPGEQEVIASAVTTNGPVTVTFRTTALAGPAARLSLSPDSLVLGVSATQQLELAVTDSFGNPLPPTGAAWSSSNEAVASVDGSGLVTGISAGQATITVRIGERSAAARVFVTTILFEDDFDTENGGTPFVNAGDGYREFAKWEVTRGGVDLVGGAGSEYDFLPGNGLYVDLDGFFKGGRLETRNTFQLTPGIYTLRFDLAGSQRGDENTVEVSLGNAYSERITLPSEAPFQTFIRTIEVAQLTSAKLVFDQFGDDGFGLLLDRVVLGR